MAILKQHASGMAIADLAHEHNVSTATIYQLRAKYGGMDVAMIKRLKKLEAENARLKKMYAEVADWLLRLTETNKRWGFGLFFLYLRNVNGYG